MPGRWRRGRQRLAIGGRRDPWRASAHGAALSVLLVVLVFFLFPIFWVIGTSVKLPGEYMRNPPVWIPQNPTLVHFTRRHGRRRANSRSRTA